MTVTGECVWFTEESMKLLDLRLFTISCVCSLPQVKDLLRGKRSTVWTPSPIPACIYRSPRIQGLFISQMYESVQKKFIRYADIFASPLSPLHWSSLISFSNQWRESHTGDTDVCPEASADPRHADPLALSRPHAWPAQGTAAFPSTTLLQRPVVVLFFCHQSTLLLLTPPCHFSHLQRLESLLICPLLYSTAASAYCTTLHWILLQCWLSQQGSLSSHHFSSYICCFFPSFHCCS